MTECTVVIRRTQPDWRVECVVLADGDATPNHVSVTFASIRGVQREVTGLMLREGWRTAGEWIRTLSTGEWQRRFAMAKTDAQEQPSITCPRCAMTSFNPNDVREGWCGRCGAFTHDAVRAGARALWDAFPTLREDFVGAWFEKAAGIVLAATPPRGPVAPPGWYPDPAQITDIAGQWERYWDGRQWLQNREAQPES